MALRDDELRKINDPAIDSSFGMSYSVPTSGQSIEDLQRKAGTYDASANFPVYHGIRRALDLKSRHGGLTPGRDNDAINSTIANYNAGGLSDYDLKNLGERNPYSKSIFDAAISERRQRTAMNQAMMKAFENPESPDFMGAAKQALAQNNQPLAMQMIEEQRKYNTSGIGGFQKDLLAAGIQKNSPEWKDYMKKYLERRTAPTAVMIGENADITKDPQTLNFMAEQLVSGDTSVLTRLGYGSQGSKNLLAIRQRAAEIAKDRGMTGADQATKTAEYFGLKAGQRTLGTRTANVEMAVNEADQMADIALTASDALKRTNVKSINDLYQMGQRATSSPELRKLAAATNSFVNAYARAISPSGTPTVHDKEHAEQVLSTGFSKGDYRAAINQLKVEMQAAKRSPGMVREEFKHYQDAQPPAQPATPTAAPKFLGFE